MKKYLVLLVMILAIIGCADDKKDNNGSNSDLPNTESIYQTYSFYVSTVSNIESNQNPNRRGYLAYSDSIVKKALANDLGGSQDNSTKTVCVNSAYYDNGAYYGWQYVSGSYSTQVFTLYAYDMIFGQCYDDVIFRISIDYEESIPFEILREYFIDQVKNNPYRDRNGELVDLKIDMNNDIIKDENYIKYNYDSKVNDYIFDDNSMDMENEYQTYKVSIEVISNITEEDGIDIKTLRYEYETSNDNI